jgi:hypothetical protein
VRILIKCTLVLACLFVGRGGICADTHATRTGSHVLTAHYVRPVNEGGPFKDRVIVFVHGIFGDATKTWTSSNGAYWPTLLLADKAFDGYDVYVATYASPVIGNTFTVDEVAASLQSRFVSDGVFEKHREVIFVCHSLGGIIVQQLLLTYRKQAATVRFLYFFAVPSEGSQVASIGKYFNSDPLFDALFHGDKNGYLLNIENQWKAADFHIARYCAYEKKKVGGTILVVDRLSGTRNCDGPSIPINEDHFGIVKPDSRSHESYIALRNAIKSDRATPGRDVRGGAKPTAETGSAPVQAHAPNGITITGGTVNNPTITNNYSSPAAAVAPTENIRDEGLALSKEITDFLAQRRSHELGPGPTVSTASRERPPDNQTPPYMIETRELFVERFETRIVNLHDKFSRRGLQDPNFESLYRYIPNMAGNVDVLIGDIAESIRELSSLSPPEGMFKDDSDAELARIALAEVNKIDAMVASAEKRMGGDAASARAANFFFLADFRDCCLNQVEYLRAEMLKRLGPSAYDASEMQSFNGSMGLSRIEKYRDGAFMIVRDYAPHFRRLCIRLERKASPPPAPVALDFTEAEVPPSNPRYSHERLGTISSPSEFKAGYVVVEFRGRVDSVVFEFPGATPVLENDVDDNIEVSKLLTWDSSTSAFAFRIGTIPLPRHFPIHFSAFAQTEFRVSAVLVFSE